MQDTTSAAPATEYSMVYWDLMKAEVGTIPSNWAASMTEPAVIPSGFEIASTDEDIVRNAPTSEAYRQLCDFIQQGSDRSAAPDFSKALYQRTLPHEIRVLRLAPGQFQQPLVASIEHINVKFAYAEVVKGWRRQTTFGISFIKNAIVPYTAISYCWNRGGFVCPIVVSGHDMSITTTLDDILRHLRDEHRSVTVWLDQLCIDQSSMDDKESQIKLMNLVYSRARNTVVWLGKEAGGEAFRALRKLALDHTGVVPDLSAEELDVLRNPTGIWAEYAQGMKDLRALLRQPWFQRTWIIQEVVLSLDVYLMAGRDTISWEDFARDCVTIETLGLFDDENRVYADRSTGGMSGLAAAVALWAQKNDRAEQQTCASMVNSLVRTRYACVTHPVDKVYGILGLCGESDIVPDYRKPAEEVYTEIAQNELKARILEFETCDHQSSTWHPLKKFLCCVDHDTDPATSILPSWAPDWSRPRLTTSFAYSTASQSYYQARDAMGRRTISFSENEKTLFIAAEPAGCAVHLSNTFMDAELTLDNSRTANDSLRQCIEFFNEPYVSDVYSEADLWMTFCSTLVAGKDHTGFQKYPEDYTETLSFLCDLVSSRSPTIIGQTYTARQKKPIGRGGLTVHHFAKGQKGRTFQSLKGAYRNALLHRKLCWTENGLVGLVPRFTRAGDTIFRFLGCVVPFVLRQVAVDKYILVGECYVLSLVDGSPGKYPAKYETVKIV